MSKFKKALTCTALLLVGVVIGANLPAPALTFELVETITESKDGFYLEEGEQALVFSDGSFALLSPKSNYYMFQPVELGDWDLSFDNEKQLKNCILTYKSMKEKGIY